MAAEYVVQADEIESKNLVANIDHAAQSGNSLPGWDYGSVSSAWAHASQLSPSASPFAGAFSLSPFPPLYS